MHTPHNTLALPTFDDVERAARRIDGVAHKTPVVTSRTVNARTGAQVFFKCENLQRGGAFKFRGAYNSLSNLSAEQRARGVVAFSSGNHAQAVALAGQLLGIPRTIVMPADSPQVKLDATADYGAEIVRYDREHEDREAIGRRLSEERGLTVIPPYDYADVIAGAGTAARELLEHTGPLDMIVTPCGGGGLVSGTALSAAALAPGCRVIGVEPLAGNDAVRSFQTKTLQTVKNPVTVADGAPGVPPQDLPRLFEPLYRSDPSRSRKSGGSGLGLAICMAIARSHDGSLSAQHSALGGLTITLDLPLKVAAQSTPGTPTERE